MKLHYLSLVAISTCSLLASCGDDDDDGSAPFSQDELVGTWEFAGGTLTSSVETAGITSEVGTAVLDSSSAVFEFREDGSFTTSGEYRVNGSTTDPLTDSVEVFSEVDEFDLEGEYFVDESSLTLIDIYDGQSDTIIYNVAAFKVNERIELEATEVEDFSDLFGEVDEEDEEFELDLKIITEYFLVLEQ